MRLGPFVITRRKSTDLITRLPSEQPGWWPVIRESFAGAWQRSITAPVQDVMAHSTAWSCITLIASDIAKAGFRLVEEDDDKICSQIENPAFSPVLRDPNHYQNRIQFIECWILSKLTRGNTYVLKERDGRGVVDAMYVLDPSRVQVMVSPLGQVFYAITQDALSGVTEASVVVPAREIIHDRMNTIFHPLVGLSPIYACGRAAMQGLKILQTSESFFEHGSQPSGVLSAPAAISTEVAERIQKHWDDNFGGKRNIGKVAVLGDGLKYEQMTMTAVDAQLIDQLKWGDERVCSTFHVPPYMVGVGPPPNYNNIEALNQQYYSQCLQIYIESAELCLEGGFELKGQLGIEFDLDALLRMDSATKMKVATEGVIGGVLSPNEARATFNRKPVKGGETPYLQQQNYSLAALNARDKAGPPPALGTTPTPPSLPPGPPPPPEPPATKHVDDVDTAALLAYVMRELEEVAA